MKYIFKNEFIFNFIKLLPKIGIRFIILLFNKKKLTCSNFRPNTPYCIKGSLNQLLWEVENAVFVTLSNSSQIFFDAGQFLFSVTKEQSQFKLIAYGVGRKKILSTQIKIVSLEKIDFNQVVTKTKSISVDYQKTIKSSNISLQQINNHKISFQKSVLPRKFKKIRIDFKHKDFMNNYSADLSRTNSIEEVNDLREVIESN